MMQTQTKRIDLTIVVLLFLGNLLIRITLVAPTGFDGLYGQDSFAYYNFAGDILDFFQRGTPPGDFYWPAGYPVILATTQSLFGITEIVAQSLNMIFAAASVGLVYILGRQLQIGVFGSLIAALLLSLSPQAFQSSIVIMADIPSLFWGLLSAVCLLHYTKTEKRRWLIICGVTLALASLTRWIYLSMAVPFALYLSIEPAKNVKWRDILIAGVSASILFLAQFLYSQVNPVGFLNHTQIQGWAITNAWQSTFTTVDGVQHYSSTNAVFYAQPYLGTIYLAPVFIPFWIIGAISILWKKQWSRAVFLFTWAMLPYAFLIGMTFQNVRFPLIVFPAVALLVGIGFETVHRFLMRLKMASYLRHGVVTLIAIVGFIMMLERTSALVTDFTNRHQQDKAVVDWVNTQIPPGETLYTFGITLTAQHYTDMKVYELFYENPQTLDERWQRGKQDYLLLNVWMIENQWGGLAPYINYHWFVDERGLEQIERMGNYTLFRMQQ